MTSEQDPSLCTIVVYYASYPRYPVFKLPDWASLDDLIEKKGHTNSVEYVFAEMGISPLNLKRAPRHACNSRWIIKIAYSAKQLGSYKPWQFSQTFIRTVITIIPNSDANRMALYLHAARLFKGRYRARIYTRARVARFRTKRLYPFM